jgi:hypothetical protein
MNLNIKSLGMIAFASFALILSSCKKDDETTEEETTAPATFTPAFSAKVDGVTFNENVLTAVESTAQGRITVSASANSSFPSMGFSMSNTITTGTYSFNGFSPVALYNTSNSTSGMYSTAAGSGTLVITSHDQSLNRISGTFNFIANPVPGSGASGSHSITEGSFSVQY